MSYLLGWVLWGWVAPMAVFVTVFRLFPPRARHYRRPEPVQWRVVREERVPSPSAELPARREIER